MGIRGGRIYLRGKLRNERAMSSGVGELKWGERMENGRVVKWVTQENRVALTSRQILYCGAGLRA